LVFIESLLEFEVEVEIIRGIVYFPLQFSYVLIIKAGQGALRTLIPEQTNGIDYSIFQGAKWYSFRLAITRPITT